MKYIKDFGSLHYEEKEPSISEGLRYHIDRELPLMESVYRIESEAWLDVINEARDLWERNHRRRRV